MKAEIPPAGKVSSRASSVAHEIARPAERIALKNRHQTTASPADSLKKAKTTNQAVRAKKAAPIKITTNGEIQSGHHAISPSSLDTRVYDNQRGVLRRSRDDDGNPADRAGEKKGNSLPITALAAMSLPALGRSRGSGGVSNNQPKQGRRW